MNKHLMNARHASQKAAPSQRIMKIRRDYNTWVADETLEDYALRFTPRSVRKWSIWRVANTAYGAVAFLALEAIGATIALNYGINNAVLAILLVSLIIFLTSLPISYYCSRYGVDMDLLSRGASFGYLGSTITSLIYASFTFILFAIEASIMAMALNALFHLPMWLTYMISALVVIPIATHGIRLISRLHLWTLPIWLALMIVPYVYVFIDHPTLIHDVFQAAIAPSPADSQHGIIQHPLSLIAIGSAATLIFALVAQVGEQADYLRFLPEKSATNRWRWRFAMLMAGPGWVFLGVLKMLGGILLMYLALRYAIPANHAAEPAQMYWVAYQLVVQNPQTALALTVLFVVISQLKINVTNAYAGSLAWSNFFSRLTHSHPGRVVWLVFNVLIAILLMEMDVFHAIEHVLGLYANLAIAWVGALVADLVINKPLGLSPKGIEFRRAYLFDVNPVGVGAMVGASLLSTMAYLGLAGDAAKALASFIALFSALLISPSLAWLTKGKYYIARTLTYTPAPTCCICERPYEAEDMAYCPAYSGSICSLCCSLDVRCHDLCKPNARLSSQLTHWLKKLLPQPISSQINTRLGHFLLMVAITSLVMGALLGLLYVQEMQSLIEQHLWASNRLHLQNLFIKLFVLLFILVCIGVWWLTLTQESRSLAQNESNRQTHLLMEEIKAHEATDAQLQRAIQVAENANNAKSRYVTGISHEIRTPLNSILGYTQLLMQQTDLTTDNRRTLDIIKRSGTHLVSLIDGLLDLASIESGKLKLERVEVNLPIFLQQITHMFQHQAAEKNILFSYSLSPQLPIFVRTDKKRLEQILINILGNAIKYTDQGQVILRVYYRSVTAIFEIEDTGCGIDDDSLQRIFKPFERGNDISAISPTASGTGLGLTIAKLLTDLLGGELTVTSQVNVGSVFKLKLFLPGVRLPEHIPLEGIKDISGYHGERQRILIVDNEPNDRDLLSKLLAKLDFIVEEAASGIDCLRQVANFQPHLIIMDINMPVMNGWQTAELLRRNQLSSAPILMVSANAFERGRDNNAGIKQDDFLPKPIDFPKLLDKIRDLLDLDWKNTREASSVNSAVPTNPDATRILHQASQQADQTNSLGASSSAPTPSSQRQLIVLSQSLTDDIRQSLLEHAHMGYVRGLLNQLSMLEQAHPELIALAQHMQQLTQRFQFNAIVELLQPPEIDEASTSSYSSP